VYCNARIVIGDLQVANSISRFQTEILQKITVHLPKNTEKRTRNVLKSIRESIFMNYRLLFRAEILLGKPSMARLTTSNQPPETPVSVDTSSRWTFLTNHAHVLIALSANPDLVLREVALRVGITERGVQRIVQDLEDDGFIRRDKVGRKNHYQVLTDQPLRHPIEAHRTIGDLLKLING
jgi:predicted transcriptional regulator